ncbi:hypothetical protein QBK99_05295 [Corticibacterium sp. UT-5YL-CI-8]|nr:hypothetical protein [Tianweitania sp. UT-5YL-CI-8]
MTEETAKPIARIVSDLPREKMIPLEYPLEFDGQIISEVRVRRVSGKEVQDYMEAIGRDESPVPPMFDLPMEVYDAMDDDDRLSLDEASLPFLPRRLRQAAARSLVGGEAMSGS